MNGIEKRILADGRAVLYRGDSLALLAAGAFGDIGAIVADPPYGIGYQHGGGGSGGSISGAKCKSKTDPIIGDDRPFDPSPWIAAAPVGRDGSRRILLWGADHFMQRLPEGGTLLAWDKHIGIGGDDSFSDCEWAWVSRKVKREVFRWLWKGAAAGKSSLDMVYSEDKGQLLFRRLHVSQKPVELMRWCVEKVRPVPGLPILDPFMGSGTTGVAVLSLGHGFIGCEIDPGHFETACQRIEHAWKIMAGEQHGKSCYEEFVMIMNDQLNLFAEVA